MDKSSGYLLRHTIAGAKPQAKGDVFHFGDVQSAWLGFMALNKILVGHPDVAGERVAAQKNINSNSNAKARAALSPDLVTVHHRILGILDGHFRQRRLLIDHLRVLRFYGLKGRSPRLWVANEARAHGLWHEALGIILPAFVEAGYVEDAFKRRWRDEMAAVLGENGLARGAGACCSKDEQPVNRQSKALDRCVEQPSGACSRVACRVQDGGFQHDTVQP